MNKKLNIICIAGLPGSGKSSLALEIQKNQVDKKVMIIDDEILMHNSSEYFFEKAEELKEYDLIIVVDVHFCRTSVREKATSILKKALDVEQVEWYFFANEPEQAILNAKNRTNKPVEQLIKAYTKTYQPEGNNIFPVYQDVKSKNKLNF